MILVCIIDIVSYTSIICMILLYDTPHYEQPHAFYACKKADVSLQLMMKETIAGRYCIIACKI
jgi:hypothetical protein